MLFRLISVLFTVVAEVWKYILTLPRLCNTKLTLATIMTGEKGTNTTFLEDSFFFFLYCCFTLLGNHSC